MHLFFTFWGFDMITKSPHGRPEVHARSATPPCTCRWRRAHPAGARAAAGHDSRWPRTMMKKSIADLGVPEVPEFLELIVASGGHLWACRMSADMNHLKKDDLYDGVEAIINARDFIEMTDGAQLLFI